MDTGRTLPALPALATLHIARLDSQLALLERLAEFGVQMCEAMLRQLKAPTVAPLAAPAPKLFQGDIGLAYARVSRAVRLSLLLQTKLLEQLVQASRLRPAQAAEAAALSEPAAQPETEPQEAVEAVEGPDRGERADREAPDDIHALLDRPADEVIDLICRDLGVSPEWVRQAKTVYPLEEFETDDFGAPMTGRRPWPGDTPGARPMKPPPRWPRASP